jgi:hypothetical protein
MFAVFLLSIMMQHFSPSLLLLFWLLISPSTSAVPSSNSPILLPFSPEHRIVIDGEFTAEEWQGATLLTLHNVVKPFDNTQAPVDTTIYTLESGDTLFVAFIANDPEPGSIRASYRDRDSIWGDDLVGIKLDTYNDARLAYQFFANPLGIQSDGIQNEMTGKESDSWNAIWQSKGQITASGYIVEIAIPLHILNFAKQDGEKTWGVEFVRFYPRENIYRITHLYNDRDNACNLCQLGKVKGFHQATQGQNLAVVPTIVAGKSRERDIEALPIEAWDYSSQQSLGFDVKWGITPEISLQATLNPDFSQVESDTGQLSVNNTFALFFPERRPFFVENADYFTTNYNLVYTRNINAPNYGLKLTGRQDRHSLGVFFADDATTNLLIPGNLSSDIVELEQTSHNFSARYRYDVNQNLSLGSITTLRESDGYHNYVNGIDAKYTPTSSDEIKIQWVHSQTQYPQHLYQALCDDDCNKLDDLNENVLRVLGHDGISGNAFRVQYARDTEGYYVRASHYQNDANFRADMGFVSRADREVNVIGGGLIWRDENHWFNYMRVSGDWDIHKNNAGELIEKEREMYFRVKGKYNTLIDVGGLIRDRVGVRQFSADMAQDIIHMNQPDWTETLDINALLAIQDKTQLFREDFKRIVFETEPTGNVSLFQYAGQGKQIDFSNNRLGDQFRSETRVDYDWGRHIRVGLDYEYQSLDAEGDWVYVAKLVDARMTYQINAQQFIRIVLSLSDIERNQNNYNDAVDAEYQDRGVQLLYSYKVNPLTKFFVGYSDAAYRNDNVAKITANEQSLFMKFSYAWQQ